MPILKVGSNNVTNDSQVSVHRQFSRIPRSLKDDVPVNYTVSGPVGMDPGS